MKIIQKTSRWHVLIFAAIVVFIMSGFFRLYYNDRIGFKIKAKHSFSFEDTIIDLDDLIGKPRILIASEHPEVKRQLEEMGVLETDEQLQNRMEQEIYRKSKQMMQNYEKEVMLLQRQSGY